MLLLLQLLAVLGVRGDYVVPLAPAKRLPIPDVNIFQGGDQLLAGFEDSDERGAESPGTGALFTVHDCGCVVGVIAVKLGFLPVSTVEPSEQKDTVVGSFFWNEKESAAPHLEQIGSLGDSVLVEAFSEPHLESAILRAD